MKRGLFFICVLICLILTGCDLFTVSSPDFYNLGFEQTAGDTDIPYGWEYHNKAGYTIRQVENKENGGKCLSIFCEKPDVRQFDNVDSLAHNSFYLKLSPNLVKGRTLEVKARVKTKAVFQNARLWIKTLAGDSLLSEINDPATGLRGNKTWQQLSLTTSIREEATDIYLGGIMNGRGTAWFDDFEIRIDGKRLKDAEAPSPPTTAEIEWLKQYIHPISSVDPEESPDDLQPLIDAIKDARIVALGSATNGSSENFRMRHKIIKALVEQCGFDFLALNTPFYMTSNLDAYVQTAKGNLSSLLHGAGSGNYSRKEFQDFIEWIRKHNEEKPPVRIVGYENYELNPSLTEVEIALEKDSLANFMISFARDEFEHNQRNRSILAGKLEKDSVGKELENRLVKKMKYVETKMVDPEFRETFQEKFQLIEELLGGKFWQSVVNAGNLCWYIEDRPESRMVLWAPNPNIKRTESFPGSYLKHQTEYVSIGFTFYDGKYTHRSSNSAVEGYPGTYEYLFHQTGEPCFMIDLRKIRNDHSPEGKIMNKPAFFRDVKTTNVTTEFSRTLLTSDFDILIFIDQSTGLKHLWY